jgi:hypothetical protein
MIFSWWWSHSRTKHVQKRNKHTKKFVHQVGFIYKIIQECTVTKPKTHSNAGRNPLAEWSARHRDNSQHLKETVIEPATPASERPQTHALDRASNGIGRGLLYWNETQTGLWVCYFTIRFHVSFVCNVYLNVTFCLFVTTTWLLLTLSWHQFKFLLCPLQAIVNHEWRNNACRVIPSQPSNNTKHRVLHYNLPFPFLFVRYPRVTR